MNRCGLLLVLTRTMLVAGALAADEPPRPVTYCNPLSLPNYPIGRFARDLAQGDTGPDWMWRLGYKQQFRELADVTALWFDGKFFLYPSVDMAWVSEDRGATWQHHPLNVRDLGYAPTIVRHKDRFDIASNSRQAKISGRRSSTAVKAWKTFLSTIANAAPPSPVVQD